MKTESWTYLNKESWGRGQWQNEPDKMQWTDEATGLPCLIVRTPHTGALCGYVGVDESHPLFGEPHGKVNLDAHGGLTLTTFCQEGNEHGICHIPAEGEPDRVWWFGFDCAHAWDLCPAYRAHGFSDYGVYRDWAYVEHECRQLAAQIKNYEN